MAATFLFGCDPEYFLKDAQGNLVSAVDLIPGTKANPHPTQHGAMQVDGIAVEVNTKPVPLHGANSTFWTYLNGVKAETLHRAETSYGKVPLYLSSDPVVELSSSFMDNQPMHSLLLGCDPDFNAYSMNVNPMPDESTPFRTSAGHIHIGWGSNIPMDSEEHFQICSGFIQSMDATVGLLCAFIEGELGVKRRELYGKAGAFRPKPYGVEYRTPSSPWTANSDYTAAVIEMAGLAVSCEMEQKNGKFARKILGTDLETVQSIINSGDKKAIKDTLSKMCNYFEASRTRRILDGGKEEAPRRPKAKRKTVSEFHEAALDLMAINTQLSTLNQG